MRKAAPAERRRADAVPWLEPFAPYRHGKNQQHDHEQPTCQTGFDNIHGRPLGSAAAQLDPGSAWSFASQSESIKTRDCRA